MKRARGGFTLQEFIIVIVIVSVVAAFAIPRFLNLNTTSAQSATNSIAASLTAVSATNYAKRTANSSVGSAIANCTSVGPLLSGGLPSGYSITSLAVAPGASVTCTLNGTNSTTATFVAIGIS